MGACGGGSYPALGMPRADSSGRFIVGRNPLSHKAEFSTSDGESG